jgi:hypothetical protein
MSVAHEVSNDGRKMTSSKPVTTEDHNSDGPCGCN